MRVRHDRGVPVQRHDRIDLQAVDLPPKRPAPGGAWDVAAVYGRVGIQVYEDENGQPVRELRPRREVMAPESIATLRGAVVTLQHPGDGTDPDDGLGEVTTTNARGLWHGHVLTADGDWPSADLLGGWMRLCTDEIMAATGQGTRQTSSGYTCLLVDPRDPEIADLVAELGPEPGVLHDGQRYDLVQTQIRFNHQAVVDIARAGPVARLRVDGKAMKRTIKIDGKSYQVAAFLADAAKSQALDAAAIAKAKADALEVGEIVIEGQTLTLPKATIDQILSLLGAGTGPSQPEPEPPMDAGPPKLPGQDPLAAPPRMDEADPKKPKADAELDAKVLASLGRVLPQALAPTQSKLADAVTKAARDRADLDRQAHAVLGDGFAYGDHDEHGVALAVLEATQHPKHAQAKVLADRARKGDAAASGSLRTLMEWALEHHRDSLDTSPDLVGAVFTVAQDGAQHDKKNDGKPQPQPWRKRRQELITAASSGKRPTATT